LQAADMVDGLADRRIDEADVVLDKIAKPEDAGKSSGRASGTCGSSARTTLLLRRFCLPISAVLSRYGRPLLERARLAASQVPGRANPIVGDREWRDRKLRVAYEPELIEARHRPMHRDPARIGRINAANHPEQGGLASPGFSTCAQATHVLR
jgi:hypothetical protein